MHRWFLRFLLRFNPNKKTVTHTHPFLLPQPASPIPFRRVLSTITDLILSDPSSILNEQNLVKIIFLIIKYGAGEVG